MKKQTQLSELSIHAREVIMATSRWGAKTKADSPRPRAPERKITPRGSPREPEQPRKGRKPRRVSKEEFERCRFILWSRGLEWKAEKICRNRETLIQ